MGFNRRKLEPGRKAKADLRPPLGTRPMLRWLKDATRLIDAWDERQARRVPFLLTPTISALAARRWFSCTTRDVDLRTLDQHGDAELTIPLLSCPSFPPHAPFAAPLH
jgi:hypothetical protein